MGVAILSGCSTARQPKTTDRSDKEDKMYIPRDLDDCFIQLKKLLSPEDIEKIKNGTEDDLHKYHFGLGMQMRNGWGLWAGSRLAKWFNARGIEHPDDMSSIILVSFWRHLNQKPIELEQQVKFYQDYWNKQESIGK